MVAMLLVPAHPLSTRPDKPAAKSRAWRPFHFWKAYFEASVCGCQPPPMARTKRIEAWLRRVARS